MELGIAIAGILPLAVEFSKMSKRYYKSFRRAPIEAQRFGTLIEEISDTLTMFCKTARDVEERKIAFARSRKTKRAVARLKRVMEASIREIRPILRKLKPIGNRKYPWIKRTIAKINWVTGDEREIKNLMVNLNTTKLDVGLLFNMFSANIQLKILEELEKNGQQIPKYLVQEIILLKERNKILNRRYKEAVKQRDALAASTVTNNTKSNREGFASLSMSFGQDVHAIIEEEMPTVEATIEEIVKDHSGSSTIEIITSSTTTDFSAPGNEVKFRTIYNMTSDADFVR
ncbi:hypothetical protein LTR84_011572 [Exophiala bonariae]|uniref:Prion-inhibition and propagation HeLo domain-containing protein n=1 Tax=Exophiala bonariae TaxID=1690606 RepID=A0AAV9NHF4_9EURO|nr:hypothetical protein LTR84_011572 [Exophiala bonariae]